MPTKWIRLNICLFVFQLRNPQRDFTFATVRGSSVDLYFKSQVEYDTIYRTMEGRNVATVEEGIQVQVDILFIYDIFESLRLNAWEEQLQK